MLRVPRWLMALVLVAVAASAALAAALHDLTGRWQLAVVTENGTGYPTLDIRQEGEKITGTYVSNAMGSRTITGSVKGDTLSFVLSAAMGGEGVVLTYTAHIVTPDSLNGLVDFAGMGGATFTGKRQK